MKKIISIGLLIIISFLVGCTETTDTTTITYSDVCEPGGLCDISFDSQGGFDVSQVSVVYGSSSELPEPVKNGYEFLGWFTGTGPNDVQFTNVTSVTRDLTLYAKWSIITYSIDSEYDYSLDPPHPLTYTIESDDIVLVSPIRYGFSFLGWYDNPDFVGDPITVIENGSYGNIQLYARWEIIENTIKYIQTFKNDIRDYSIEWGIFVSSSYSLDLISDGKFGSSFFDNYGTFIQIAKSESHYGFLTSEHKVLMYGQNNYGQLGNGSTGYYGSFVDITENFDLIEEEYISKISCGMFYSAAITNLGRVFAWGDNSHMQLGEKGIDYSTSPLDITHLFDTGEYDHIVDIALGSYSAIAISNRGKIFVWGLNEYGVLLGMTEEKHSSPIDISDSFNLDMSYEHVVQIGAGRSHFVILTETGKVLSWGRNNYGQLGNGTFIDSYEVQDITSKFHLKLNEVITQISVGSFHSSALTSFNRVFTWGNNSYGQLGSGDYLNYNSPKDITSEFGIGYTDSINNIFLSNNISIATTSYGKIFIWGSNGVLRYDGVSSDTINTPTLLPSTIIIRISNIEIEIEYKKKNPY